MPHSSFLADSKTDTLVLGEQLLLWSLRSWAKAAEEGACPLCAILEPFALIKAEPLAEALHESLALLLRPSARRLRLHRPAAGVVSEDESRFLLAAAAAFHEDSVLAGRLLTGLLDGKAAGDLAAALAALATLLSRHGLPLPQRLPPVMRLATPMAGLGANAGMALVH
ncbi:MAG: hypothetical protein Kilf2KO_39090 [Rhodospirillales bacterium]